MTSTSLVPSASDAAHLAASHAVMKAKAKSFRFASLFLPQTAADDAAVLYAFCRDVDDAVDEAPSAAAAEQAGAQLEAELNGARPARATVAAFLALAERRGIDVGFAQDLVAGARSDAGGRVRITDDDALVEYCYRVAGTVGGMMCPILGVTNTRALSFAIDLGIAMQITNICRDVLEDSLNNRVYLPATRLRLAGVDPEALVEGKAQREGVAQVVRDLLALADRYYARGDAGLRFIPWRARTAIAVASRVYRAIGVRLRERHDGDALHGRTVVPLAGKLMATLKAFGLLAWVGLGGARGDVRAGLPGRELGSGRRIAG